MAESGLIHPLLISLAAFLATPLLALIATVLIAWLIVALSDGPTALMVVATVALLLTFVIQAALLLAPRL
jgi:hypothetical protein